MTPDIAIAWLLFNFFLIVLTLIWGIFRFRQGAWYRKLVLRFQAYLLWGIGGVALLSSIIPFSYLYTEHIWRIENVGYSEVFWKIRQVKWGLFAGFFFIALLFLNLNGIIAKRLCPEPREFARWTRDRTVAFHRVFFCGTVLVALILAVPMMSLDDVFIRYIERPVEPIEPFLLGKDRNFFLFSFPMHQSLSLWVNILLWTTCIFVAFLYNYYYRRDARSKGYVKRNIVLHGTVLWLMLLAAGIWTAQVHLWSKLYKPSLSRRLSEYHGWFYADSMLAGATQIYFVILLAIGVVLIFNLFWRRRIIWYASIAILLVGHVGLLHVYPMVINYWTVRTAGDAISVEKDFLKKHIRDTRTAYDLNQIKRESYKKGLTTLDTIERNEEVKHNIQFWDRRVYYNILQNTEIKLNHNFHPYADVDRYRLSRLPESETVSPEIAGDEVVSENQESPENSANSVEKYRQVLISAREIDPDRSPRGPREWGELKLKFTHGYGVCVAPVNAVTSDNKPDLWVKGVPIRQKKGMDYAELEVSQPRIYYGEMTNDYVIVNTKQKEHNIEDGEATSGNNTTVPEVEDTKSQPEQNIEEAETTSDNSTSAPEEEDTNSPEPNIEEAEGTSDNSTSAPEAADTNKGYHYTGEGGVKLGGLFRRFCFAVRFTSVFILRNSNLKPDSRVMFWRRIGTRKNDKLVTDRLSQIAPFLDYDPDPYIVIHDGKLWWIVDFYVTSDWFPNAQPYSDDTAPIEHDKFDLYYVEPRFKRFKRFNYIRNPGVAVVNAYTGQVDFYTDIENEAITEIYKKAYPKLFKNIEDMPEGLRSHRRFPDYLTRIQARKYGAYRVQDAEQFFDKNHQWKISKEAYYPEEAKHEMMPYYVMLKLPDEDKAEFVNMIPFTPPKKDKFLKGWMIARCDPPHYGQRIVYTLSEEDVKGPKHVEADIKANNDMQKLVRDFGEHNDIIGGNLHVVPIEDGIFYIKPFFVQPKEIKGKNGSDVNITEDPIRDPPTLKRIVVAAEETQTADKPSFVLAADESFDQALRKIFLGQPSGTTTETDDEETLTLSEQFEVLLKSVEDFGKALKAAENGNAPKKPAKAAAGNNKKNK